MDISKYIMEIKNTIKMMTPNLTYQGCRSTPNEQNNAIYATRSKAIQLYFSYTEMVENEVV